MCSLFNICKCIGTNAIANDETACSQVDTYSRTHGYSANSPQRRILKIGIIEVGKTIGRGRFGDVRVGKNANTGLELAVKMIECSTILIGSGKSDAEIRLHGEYHQTFRHPNILHLDGTGRIPGYIAVFMELAQGGTLYDYVRKKEKLNEFESRHLLQQLIGVVEYLHRRNLFSQRNLRLDHILMDNYHNLKISDLNLAFKYSSGIHRMPCNGLGYVAPELLTGWSVGGPECSMWSCGIALYFMLVGHFPFSETFPVSMYQQIVAGKFDIPQEFDADLSNLFSGLTDTNPNTRTTLSQTKEHSWFRHNVPSSLFGVIETSEHALLNPYRRSLPFNWYLHLGRSDYLLSFDAVHIVSKKFHISEENVISRTEMHNDRASHHCATYSDGYIPAVVNDVRILGLQLEDQTASAMAKYCAPDVIDSIIAFDLDVIAQKLQKYDTKGKEWKTVKNSTCKNGYAKEAMTGPFETVN